LLLPLQPRQSDFQPILLLLPPLLLTSQVHFFHQSKRRLVQSATLL
jgi:hypothetical protein